MHIVPRNQPTGVDVGNETPDPGPRPNSLRTDVDLVLVPTVVINNVNRPVTDLQKNNFTVFEDGEEQQIRFFSKEDQPISVGLILDFSASMSNKFIFERTAAEQFFKYANPLDDYFVIAFSDRPYLIADTTQSIDDLDEKLTSAIPAGNTALLDAVYLGLAKMKSAQYRRRALLIISDGGDNHSHYNSTDTKRLVQESDVLIYSIGLFDNMPVPLFKTIEEKLGKRLLTQLTDTTGGRTIAADNREKIPQIAAAVSQELREQYVLGYKSSNNNKDGKWRKIKLRVTPRAGTDLLHAYYKQGYIASAR